MVAVARGERRVRMTQVPIGQFVHRYRASIGAMYLDVRRALFAQVTHRAKRGRGRPPREGRDGGTRAVRDRKPHGPFI